MTDATTYYHGSTRRRESWDYASLGHGLDQHGPGWYFTDEISDANRYAQGETGAVHHCKLGTSIGAKNAIPSEVSENWADGLRDKIEEAVRSAPEFEDNMTNWAEDPESAVFLATDSLIEYTEGPADFAQTLWNDHYRGDEEAWAKCLIRLFGWDAYFPPAGPFQHVVVWNPEIITIDSVDSVESE